MKYQEIRCIYPPFPHPHVVVKNQNMHHFFLLCIKQRGGYSRENLQGVGFLIKANLTSASLGQKDRKKPHPLRFSLETPSQLIFYVVVSSATGHIYKLRKS